MTGMTALLWLPLVLSRTVVSPEEIAADETVTVDFGLAASEQSADAGAHKHPGIIVGPDGELELAPEQEDSNLRVDAAHKGRAVPLADRLHREPAKAALPAHEERAKDVHAGIAHNVQDVHTHDADDESHMRTGHHRHHSKAKKRVWHHVASGVPLARGFLGMGVSAIVMIGGFLIAQYVMNVARCVPQDQELENKAENGGCVSPTSRVARLLPCQCSRRNEPPRTVAAFGKSEGLRVANKQKKGKKGRIEIPQDHSESSLASAEAYDLARTRYTLPPLEEKEPEPEHEEESELGPKLEGATSYVVRVVKARVEGTSAEKKTSLAWTINSEGQDPPPRPSRFNKDMVWDAPVDKVDLDISDPNVPVSVAVLAAADNPIEPPSPVAWATITASLLLAEGSGNRPKAKNMKKDTMYVHTKTIPLEPLGTMTLEYSIIAFFHWVVP